MRDTLELVVDDKLGHELDKAEHVDGLRERRDDERVPRAMRPVWSAITRSVCPYDNDTYWYSTVWSAAFYVYR